MTSRSNRALKRESRRKAWLRRLICELAGTSWLYAAGLGCFGAAPATPTTPSPAGALLKLQPIAKPRDSIELNAPESTMPDDAVRALANDLSLESRRYLLYLYARMNRPHIAEALAERILKENPGDQRTLLVMASMYVERKDAEKALETARRLTALYPDDDQSRYFLGAAYFVARRYDQAEHVWKELKRRKFANRSYPYESDLASAALKSGDWFRAKLAYEELLSHHKLRQPLRLDSRQVLETIYRAHLPQLHAYGTAALLKNGSIWRPGASYRQHVEDRQTLFSSFETTLVDIKEAPGLRATSASNLQGFAGIESVWRKVWKTSVWAGGSGAGPLGGLRVNRNLGDLNDIELEMYLGDRVSDGLLIERLNGRQNRATLTLNQSIRRNLSANVQLTGREVTVAEGKLGQGMMASGTLDYVLKRGWPEWHAGWRSYWSAFQHENSNILILDPIAAPGSSDAQRSAMLSQLILSSLHREGVYANFRHQFSGLVHLRGTAGLDYSFDRSAVEYYGQAGLAVYPRKRLELGCGISYSSSARSADQNSDQWLLDFGLKYWF